MEASLPVGDCRQPRWYLSDQFDGLETTGQRGHFGAASFDHVAHDLQHLFE